MLQVRIVKQATRAAQRCYSIFDKFKSSSIKKISPPRIPASTLALPPLSQPFVPANASAYSNQRLSASAKPSSFYGTTSYSSDKAVTITTLPNGLRIATADPYLNLSHVLVAIKSGPRYETDETLGTAWLLQTALGGGKYSRKEFSEALENLGASYANVINRDCTFFYGEVLNHQVKRFMDLLADAVVSPDVSALDVMKDILALKMSEYDANPAAAYLSDGIHRAAYGNATLGKPILTRQSLDLTADTVQKYIETFFRPSNMVVAATGVHHDAFVELVVNKFQFDATRSKPMEVGDPKAEWLGGLYLREFTEAPYELHKQNMPLLTHAMCAFQGPPITTRNVIVSYLLSTLVGSTASFSSGGPGKGILSRLATNRKACELFDSIELQYEQSMDTGTFGVQATAFHTSFSMGHLVNMVQQMVTMSTGISPIELSRSKNRLKTSVIENMESGLNSVTNIALPLMWRQPVDDVPTICEQIDAITVQDMQEVAWEILTSPLAIAVVGNTAVVPDNYEEIVHKIEKALSIRLAPRRSPSKTAAV